MILPCRLKNKVLSQYIKWLHMKLFLPTLLLLVSVTVQAQVTLTTSPYTEDFNNLGSAGLPAGFFVKKAVVDATPLGVDTILNTGVTPPWRGTSRGFKNFASATGVSDVAIDSATQSAITNRALGVRQTSTTGWDPGVAFLFQVTNTTGKFNFQLSFKLQSLDPTSPRKSTWIVDYGIGATPATFTAVTTSPAVLETGGSTFSNTSVTVDFGNALNDQAGPVWIRVRATPGSTGSGNRASSAIDDWSLSWSTTSATRDIIRDNNYVKLSGQLSSGLNVTFNKAITGSLKMQLTNMTGQVIWQKQINRAIQGQVESIVPGASIPNGIYMLSISSKEGTYTRQIAVQ
jgi:hypothetical protein